jgi:hypothetical protein
MSRTDYQTLINRGRKAGLRTSELYSALSTRGHEATDLGAGQADANGYTSSINQDGRRVYQPIPNRNAQ